MCASVYSVSAWYRRFCEYEYQLKTDALSFSCCNFIGQYLFQGCSYLLSQSAQRQQIFKQEWGVISKFCNFCWLNFVHVKLLSNSIRIVHALLPEYLVCSIMLWKGCNVMVRFNLVSKNIDTYFACSRLGLLRLRRSSSNVQLAMWHSQRWNIVPLCLRHMCLRSPLSGRVAWRWCPQRCLLVAISTCFVL